MLPPSHHVVHQQCNPLCHHWCRNSANEMCLLITNVTVNGSASQCGSISKNVLAFPCNVVVFFGLVHHS